MGIFSGTAEKTGKTKSKKLKEEGCVVTLQIEIPAAKVQETTHNVLVRLQSQARLPGFRQGKAPLEVVQKHLAGHIHEKVADELIRQAVPEALSEHQMHPVVSPAVHSLEMPPGQGMKFQAVIECPPNVQVKNYKKLPVTRKKYPSTEEEISNRLKELQEGNANLQAALQESVEKHHYAVVDYEGFSAGKPMKGAKGLDQLLDMSAQTAAEGLQAGLLGAKRGETREIPVTIDKNQATFRVTVKEIKSKVLPNLDDEFAKDIGYASLAELKTKIRELIEHEGQRKAEQEVIAQIEEGLLKANTFPVPPTLVEHQLERMMERLRTQMLGPKRDWPQAERDKLREKLVPGAENQVRMAYLLRAIAAAEKIEATPQDMEQELNRNLEAAESDAQKEDIRKLFAERKEDITEVVIERKVMEFLKNAAAVTEA